MLNEILTVGDAEAEIRTLLSTCCQTVAERCALLDRRDKLLKSSGFLCYTVQ